MTSYEQAKILFDKTLAKQNNISTFEQRATKDELILYIKNIIDDYSTLITLTRGDVNVSNNRALSRFALANVYIDMGNNKEAQRYLYKARGEFEHILKNFPLYHRNYLNKMLVTLELVKIIKQDGYHQFMGSELDLILKDYLLFLKLGVSDIDLWDEFSTILDEVAKLYLFLDEYSNALKSFEYSIHCNKEILLLDAEDRVSFLNIAISKVEKAKIYLLLGQQREAIELYNESIDSLKYENDIISLNAIALSCSDLANIYRYEMIIKRDKEISERAEGLYLKSIKYYKKALKIDAYDAYTYSNLAGSYYEFSLFYIYIQENKKSIEVSQKSLDMLYRAVKIDRYLDVKENINASKMNLAEAYNRESQYQKSLEILESIIDNEESKNRLNRLTEMGKLYVKIGEIERALEFFNKAFNNYLEKFKQNLNHLFYLENFSLLLSSILEISQKSFYIDKALWCNHQIIEIYDGYFIDIGFEDDSFSMSQKMMVYLNRLLDAYVLSEREPNEKLVELLEMVKAKRLKQLMEANRLDKMEEVKVKQLKKKLDIVKREIAKDSLDMFNIGNKERLYEKFQDYSQQLSRILNLKRDKLDIYQTLEYKSLLLYPIYNNQKLKIISVEKREKVKVTISCSIIEEDIKFSDYLLFIKFMEQLICEDKFLDINNLHIMNNIKIDKKIKKDILKIDEDEFMEEYKYKIIEIALLHIRDEVIKLIPKGVDKILFAPFGDLNMLPLHAISIEEDRYLIEKYEIVYIASLSLMENLKSNPTSNRVTSKDNLVISMEGLHDEAQNILEAIDGEALKDIEAVEFKEYIKDKKFNILHFSTHGSANLSYPLNSHLVFNESRLNLLEVFGLNIDANLINISACETYLSEIKGADEVLAFERAFLIAGAKSIISTFSTVSIMGAEDFMTSFYEFIKEDRLISKSFQKASIKDIENGSMEWSLFRLMES